MRYRAEIDGLRAVAVLPVILFHAGFGIFSGGFVGVDIFFVISGYLITTIIHAELEAGEFSIVKFYERRARRILPALFLVMATCLPFAWMWLVPSDMKNFSQSLVAVSVFASNILFWRQSGYFDAAAELKPLLHTWSLAVEEQFYIFFPLFLLFAWRLGRKWILAILGVISLISLALAHYGANMAAEATFYLLPTRAWELAIGSFVAFYLKDKERKEYSQKLYQCLSAVGFGLIVISIFVYSKATPFPSLYALAPTIGAALIIIFALPRTLVGDLLGSKLFVGIGLISYSAYLWHQPLFAFAKNFSLFEPEKSIMAVLILATFSLAFLSWRFVETPFRNRGSISRKQILAFSILGEIVFASVGLSGHLTNGLPNRMSMGEQGINLVDGINVAGLSNNCEDYKLSKCKTSDAPSVLAWGDSYAMQLIPALSKIFSESGLAQYTKETCNPVFDIAQIVEGSSLKRSNACIDFNSNLLKLLDEYPSINTVVISTPFSNILQARILKSDGETLPNDSIDVVEQYFSRTLQKLESRGLHVVVVSPPPWPDYGAAGDCGRKSLFAYGNLNKCNFTTNQISSSTLLVNKFIESVVGRNNLRLTHFIDLSKVFCQKGTCRVGEGVEFFYGKGGHLSLSGSMELSKNSYFINVFESVK